MSDRCDRISRPTDVRISRRALIGSGVALGGALVLGSTTAATAAGAGRHVVFRRFDGAAAFARGTRAGTRPGAHGLSLGDPTQQRTYADPYASGASATYDVGTWTSPVIHNSFRLTELIASWNAQTPGKTWIEISVQGRADDGVLTDWYILGRWCSHDPEQGGAIYRTSVDDQGDDYATIYTDTLATQGSHTLNDVQLRVQLMRPAGSTQSPTLQMIGVMCSALPSSDTVPTSPAGPGRGIVLDVPPYSQELHIGQYPQWDNGGEAWCSPTSTSMALAAFGAGPSAADLSWVEPMQDPQVAFAARNTFDYTYDGCGNWPFNTAYAARFGLRGFVTRLRDMREAEGFIAAGIPLIMSVSFTKEELDGAGYSTNGHLMLLRGFDSAGNPVMNDPASHLVASNDEVRVTYDRGQLENAWIPHSGGTVYVIHPASRALPAAGAEANW